MCTGHSAPGSGAERDRSGSGYGELACRLHKTALVRDHRRMEPTVGNPRAALNGSHEQLTAEPGNQDALTPGTGDAEPASRKPQRVRASLRRVQPRRLARDIAVSMARVQPGRLARSIARRVEGIWRQHPLEATSITLMALAGLAYPFPFWSADFAIWLIGAAIAVPSRLWDLRDKWSGLAGPVALVIVGTAITLAVGGTRTTMPGYVHEALAGSVYLIKAGSVAGAVYLAWRVSKGRRIQAVPPWLRQARR